MYLSVNMLISLSVVTLSCVKTLTLSLRVRLLKKETGLVTENM